MSDVKRWILKNGKEHNGYVLAADYDQLLDVRDGLEKERDQLRAERDNLFAERKQLESELRHRQKLIDDAWHAWEVALKGCEAMRSERDSHQRLCIDEMEKNAQLRAELEAIREQEPDTWPTLDKPAKVGAVLFNPGLSARLVVEAAQRQHEYSQQPEVEAARLERFKRAMREFHGEQPDAVSVPRELLERISLSRPCEPARYQAIDELRALLSTKNAEEGE